MPKGNPNPLCKIKKGTVLNPQGINGFTHLPPEVKQIQQFSKEEHIKVVSRLISLTAADLKKIVNDPKTTIHELIVAKLMVTCINKGDSFTYEKIMDRLIGRVPLPLTGDKGAPLIPATTINFDGLSTKDLEKIASLHADKS